jgi:hypothetical protein
MILYFDVYIVDEDLTLPVNLTSRRAITEDKIQKSCYAYRKQKKIDITKYTLASYSIIDWEHVIIRYECQNDEKTEPFYDYCRELFPNAEIYNQRSDTAVKYASNLGKLKNYGNPWIFFSPNNDHPYVANSIGYLEKMIEIAEKIEKQNKDKPISISYSHFIESINSTEPIKYLWGKYAFIFPKKFYEDDISIGVVMNKYVCDSIHIFRLNDLIKIFENTQNNGRVIRIEDTEFYLNKNIKNIVIVPKIELCGHFDGYFHHNVWNDIASAPPPLLIPEGFFEDKISIKYGYKKYYDGYVNINPVSKKLKYIDNTGTDLQCSIDEIPLFWKNRIIEIDINPELNFKEEFSALKNNKKKYLNPWRSSNIVNFIRSYLRYFTLPLKLSYQYMRTYMYNKYGKMNFYRYFVKIRDKYFGFPY